MLYSVKLGYQDNGVSNFQAGSADCLPLNKTDNKH